MTQQYGPQYGQPYGQPYGPPQYDPQYGSPGPYGHATGPGVYDYAQAYGQAPPRNGFGIAALCLALAGIVFGLVPFTGFIALILGMMALVFGLLGLARVGNGVATNSGMSLTGTVLGFIAVALGIWGLVIVFQATDQFVNDMNTTVSTIPRYGSGSPYGSGYSYPAYPTYPTYPAYPTYSSG